MKLFIPLFITASFMTACNSMEKAATAESKIDASLLTVSADPVCGMDMREYTITDTAVYKGNTYGFCAPGCKDEFKKDPEAKLNK